MTNDRHGNRAKRLKGSHALNYLTKSEAELIKPYSDKICIRNYCLVIHGIIVQGVLNSI